MDTHTVAGGTMITKTGLWVGAFCVLGGAAMAESAAEERGAYLVRGLMGCGNCHTPMDPEGPIMAQELAGNLILDTPEMTAWAANVTPGGRVADWSDAELGRAIREGVRPDGSLIGPPMPFMAYRGLGDDDLAAVVAFLRRLPAVEGETLANMTPEDADALILYLRSLPPLPDAG